MVDRERASRTALTVPAFQTCLERPEGIDPLTYAACVRTLDSLGRGYGGDRAGPGRRRSRLGHKIDSIQPVLSCSKARARR